MANNEIGAALFLSPATARTHVSHAMVKLGARDRAQLVVIAYQTGLVTHRLSSPGWMTVTPGAESAGFAGRSAVDRPLQLGLGHRRSALDVATFGFFVELITGPSPGTAVRSLTTALTGRHVRTGQLRGCTSLARPSAFLVDRTGGDLFRPVLGLAPVFGAVLDVFVLALAFRAQDRCGMTPPPQWTD